MPCVGDVGQNPHLLHPTRWHASNQCILLHIWRGILESPGPLRKHLMQIWPEYSTYKPKNCSTVKKGLIILMLTNELSFKRPIDEKITLFRSRRIHENEAKKLKIEEQKILSSLSLMPSSCNL